MKKVLTILITADQPLAEVWAAVRAQDYPAQRLLVHWQPPVRFAESYIDNVYRNCSANRNAARTLALASDAELFWFLDDDVVPPPDALRLLVSETGSRVSQVPAVWPDGTRVPSGAPVPERHIVGGWYPMRGGGKWVAGKFVGDHLFLNFPHVQPGLVPVDMVGLGCALLSRAVLEAVEFRDGLELRTVDAWNPSAGLSYVGGECLAFANAAAAKGFDLFMHGGVVCEHRVVPREFPPINPQP
jgi:hypothetical protein